MSLLSNIQAICAQVGLTQPTYIIGNNDLTAQQLLAFMNLAGEQLVSETDWQFLAREWNFQTNFYQYTGTVTAGSSTITNLSSITGLSSQFMVSGVGMLTDTMVTSVSGTSATISMPATASAANTLLTFGQTSYTLPSDWDRITNKTAYNKNMRWSVIGPKSAQEWQWLKASYMTNGPRQRFRIFGNTFDLWPIPSQSQEMRVEYQSNAFAIDGVTGAYKNAFTLDSDTCLFPDVLIQLAAKMFFMEQKGFDSSATADQLSRQLSKYKAQNAGADVLSLAPQYPNQLLTQAQLPDTGFGNTTS